MLVTDDNNQQTALHWAVWAGKKDTVKDLLDRLKDHHDLLRTLVIKTDIIKRTSLHLASMIGRTEIVKTLLDSVKNFKFIFHNMLESDTFGSTPLHLAIYNNHAETVKTLLNWAKKSFNDENPHDITKLKIWVLKDSKVKTALYGIVYSDHAETVKTLLNWVKVNLDTDTLKGLVLKADEYRNQFLLHWAVRRGNTATATALLDSVKKDLETLKELVLATDQDKRTALYLAVWESKEKTAKALLDGLKSRERCTRIQG